MQIQYLATWWKRYNSFCKQRGQPIIYSNKNSRKYTQCKYADANAWSTCCKHAVVGIRQTSDLKYFDWSIKHKLIQAC